ncbi:MAG: type IV pilin protein [Nitrosomonas sp.]|jgi:type IV pilus assembly protein PilE
MKQLLINTRGFTLVELMIVVAIAGILASVAYPSYVDSVQRGNRAEARGILLEIAQSLERNFTEANRYDQNSAGNAFTLPVAQSPRTGAAKYTIQFSAGPTQTTYTLGAVPAGTMTGDACGTLTLTHTGVKSAGGTVADCWQR